jgi:hypothetical protein
MEMPRRLINLIGAAVVTLILVAGMTLAVVPVFSTAKASSDAAEAATAANATTKARVATLAEQNARLEELRTELANLRLQLTADDELLDASALASTAAKSSGARVVAITFGDRQTFTAPAGGGLADTKSTTTTKADANTAQVQIPVTFEAETTSVSQAANFIDGLRTGTRLLQIVQAECAPTNNAKKFTVTVDALVFAAKG